MAIGKDDTGIEDAAILLMSLGEEEAAAMDAEQLMLQQTQLKRLDNARAMAKSNPAAVAHIVRGWVNGEST